MPILSEEQKQALEDAMRQIESNTGILKNNDLMQEFSAEKQKINEVLKTKNPLISEYVKLFKDAEKRPYTNIGRMAKEMKTIVAKQEILKLAAELCNDDASKEALKKQYEKLNQDPAIISYRKYIKGLQYLSGMTATVEPEVERFFASELRVPFFGEKDDPIYENYRTGTEKPATTENKKLEQDYLKALAPTKAKELFSRQATKFAAIEEQFLGTDYIGNRNTYSERPFTDRVTPSSFCVGKMLQMGYSLDQVLDPRALIDVKKEVGAFYKNIRDTKNVALYTEEMYKNCEAMIASFKDYVKKHKDELKTETDLVHHMSKLGMLANYCYDNLQELPKGAEKIKDLGINFPFKTQKELSDMATYIGTFAVAAGNSNGAKINYHLEMTNGLELGAILEKLIYMNRFLEEIQKDDPNYDSFLLTGDDRGEMLYQIHTLPEFEAIFGEETNIDPEIMDLDKETLSKLAHMFTMDFVKENKLTYDRARVPLTVTKTPSYTMGNKDDLQKDDTIHCAVTRGDKQLVLTNMYARIDKRLRNLEPKNFRGKEKDNSPQFNTLLKVYDDMCKNVADAGLSDKEYLEELAKMKEASLAYLNAKRAQKGYPPATQIPDHYDSKMRGAEKGKGLATKKGKDRYVFAMTAVIQIEKVEKAIKEKAMKDLSTEKTENKFRNDSKDTITKKEEKNSNNLQVINEEVEKEELEDDGISLG